MSAPVILFPDAQLATRDLLRRILADRGIAADVSTRDPAVDDAKPRTRPYVRVRSGASDRDTRVSAEALVRVTAYGVDEGASLAFAALIEGLLLAEASSADIVGFRPGSGPIPIPDPTLGISALVVVTARLRPRQL